MGTIQQRFSNHCLNLYNDKFLWCIQYFFMLNSTCGTEFATADQLISFVTDIRLYRAA